MKVAHLPFCYYPDPAGGTEVYVEALVSEHRSAGLQPFIIAPAAATSNYHHAGIPVYRYRVESAVMDVSELYAAHDSVDEAAFERVLEDTRPDILHVHGYSAAVTPRMLRAARERDVRIAFTYHTPTATCMRGTLQRWGHVTCDGMLDARRCAACTLHAGGAPRPLGALLAQLPALPKFMTPRGRVGTALRMSELVRLRHAEIREFLSNVDRVIATADWVMSLLLRLGVPADRITMNRQGTLDAGQADATRTKSDELRLAFFGRVAPEKGLHVLLHALRMIPQAKLRLSVYGISGNETRYARDLSRRAARDPRVGMHQPVDREVLLKTMQANDAVVVPSQWLETGPLVVLESFAAGRPVIGSGLGGISELVRDGIDGLLVEPASDPKAWARVLTRLIDDPALLEKLRAQTRAPRTMKMVAAEMQAVYAAMLGAA